MKTGQTMQVQLQSASTVRHAGNLNLLCINSLNIALA
jgi:hypothetical protein